MLPLSNPVREGTPRCRPNRSRPSRWWKQRGGQRARSGGLGFEATDGVHVCGVDASEGLDLHAALCVVRHIPPVSIMMRRLACTASVRADVAIGPHEEGLTALREVLAVIDRYEVRLLRVLVMVRLAGSLTRTGPFAEAEEMLVDALALIDRAHVWFHSSELTHLKGTLSLHRAGVRDMAVARLGEAVTVAHPQSARSLELARHATASTS